MPGAEGENLVGRNVMGPTRQQQKLGIPLWGVDIFSVGFFLAAFFFCFLMGYGRTKVRLD